MQIKATVKFHHTPIRMTTIRKKTQQYQVFVMTCNNWITHILQIHSYSHIEKQHGSFLHEITYTLHTCTIWYKNSPRCLTKRSEIYVHTKTYAIVFIAALFVIVKNWEEPKYPSSGEWINKLWYIHTVEYSVLDKSKNIMLQIEAQAQNAKVGFHLSDILKQTKL